jgi:signal peptidase
LLSIVYALINFFLPAIINSRLEAYVVRPLIWILLGIITLFVAKHEGLNITRFNKIRNWQIGRSPVDAGLLVGGFQVSLLIITGLFAGFAKSPYAPTFQSFLANTILFCSMLFGLELSRTYLIKKGLESRINISILLCFTALLFMIIRMQFIDFALLNTTDPASLSQFIGGSLIPLFTASLFASYLAYIGGAFASIGYLGVLQIFHYYTPLFPNPSWIILALVSTIAPAIGFIIIQNSIQYPSKRRTNGEKDPMLNAVAVTILCIIIVFFSFGYLGVTPTIISSGSMRPTLDTGDVVVLEKVNTESIEIGDIIQYNMQNVSTIHRVQNIICEQNSLTFITKGDANTAADVNSVSPRQITGKAIFTIPKIGLVPLMLKSFFLNA